MDHYLKKLDQSDERQIVKEWLSALENPSVRLTEWELSFINSISLQFYEDYSPLSSKQLEVLENIYANKTS